MYIKMKEEPADDGGGLHHEGACALCDRVGKRFHEKATTYGHIGTYLEMAWEGKTDDFCEVGVGRCAR